MFGSHLIQEIAMAEMAERKERKWAMSWGGYVEELKKGSRIAAPMVAVTVLQYLLQVVSVIMVGHLGQLSLSSVAIATSLTNVTGFSLLVSTLPSVYLIVLILSFQFLIIYNLNLEKKDRANSIDGPQTL